MHAGTWGAREPRGTGLEDLGCHGWGGGEGGVGVFRSRLGKGERERGHECAGGVCGGELGLAHSEVGVCMWWVEQLPPPPPSYSHPKPQSVILLGNSLCRCNEGNSGLG